MVLCDRRRQTSAGCSRSFEILASAVLLSRVQLGGSNHRPTLGLVGLRWHHCCSLSTQRLRREEPPLNDMRSRRSESHVSRSCMRRESDRLTESNDEAWIDGISRTTSFRNMNLGCFLERVCIEERGEVRRYTNRSNFVFFCAKRIRE